MILKELKKKLSNAIPQLLTYITWTVDFFTISQRYTVDQGQPFQEFVLVNMFICKVMTESVGN